MQRGAPKLAGFMPLSWRALRYGAPRLRAGAADKHALRPGGAGPYDAPELRGLLHASASELAAADVWGLGVVLVSLMLGQPPLLVGASGEQLQPGEQPVHYVRLPGAMPTAPAGLTVLVWAMLSIHPADRPSIEAVSAALAALAPTSSDLPSAPNALAAPKAPEAPIAGLALGTVDAPGFRRARGRECRSGTVGSEASGAWATPPSEAAMSAPAANETWHPPTHHAPPPTPTALLVDASAGRSVLGAPAYPLSCPLSPPINPTGAPHAAKQAFELLPLRAGGPAGAPFVDSFLTRRSSVGSSSTRSASPSGTISPWISPDINTAAHRTDAPSPAALGAWSARGDGSENAGCHASACAASGGRPSHGMPATKPLPTISAQRSPQPVFRRLQPKPVPTISAQRSPQPVFRRLQPRAR